MGTVNKVNDIICDNISKIDDILKANANKLDDNFFCPAGPIPTTTTTTTVEPTTTTTTDAPCLPDCCETTLCYGIQNASEACSCLEGGTYYLHQPCNQDPCELAFATGIFVDNECLVPADSGFYSTPQIGAQVYAWDGAEITFIGGCKK